ncbi:MAG TPA: hypothetical protein VE990_12325 [Acidimicrobiales bacterium]|nr:hypothetical protein [Acidimicrobiales bacterium]
MTTEPAKVFVARVSNPAVFATLTGLIFLDTANRAAYIRGRRFGPIGAYRPKHPEWPLGRRVWTSVVIGVVGLMASFSIRVVAGPDGLSVGFGPWGWPVRHIPIARIRSVRVQEGKALPLFGYGYRALPGHTRVVVRSGPVLVVEMTDGASFGVTIGPGAGQAAEAINAAIAGADWGSVAKPVAPPEIDPLPEAPRGE